MSLDDRTFGIPELDSTIAPYLPGGWLGLLTGPSGAGTHLLAKQFAAAGVGSSPVLYYTTDERTQDIQQAFRDYGWDPEGVRILNLDDEYYERVLVRQLEVSRTRERGLRAEEVLRAGQTPLPLRPFSLTSRVLADLAQLDGPFRLIIDSVDFLIEILGASELIVLARQIRRRAQSLGGQAVLILQPQIHDARTTGLLDEMADLIIGMETVGDGDRFVTRLTVRKIRNHPERNRVLAAEVTESGLRFQPPAPSGSRR
jgi:KaiC/GvpD/RAD55 family RecA-like ATPase